MNIVHLQNLIALARKGVSAISENLEAEQAAAAWEAIKEGESILKQYVEAAQAQQSQETVTEGNTEGTTSDLHVVNLDGDGTIPTEPKSVEDNA